MRISKIIFSKDHPSYKWKFLKLFLQRVIPTKKGDFKSTFQRTTPTISSGYYFFFKGSYQLNFGILKIIFSGTILAISGTPPKHGNF